MPPPRSCQQVVAVTAAERIDWGGGTSKPFPKAFAGQVTPELKTTPSDGNVGGASGGSLAQRVSQVSVSHHNDRGGGVVSGGGDVPFIKGYTEQTVHADKRGGWHGDGVGGGGGRGGGRADGNAGGDGSGLGSGVQIRQADGVDPPLHRDSTVTASAGTLSTEERDEFGRNHERSGVTGVAFVGDTPKPALDAKRDTSSNGPRGLSDRLLLGQAVGAAAREVAFNCHIPGVCEAAAAVSILVTLVTDNRQSKTGSEASLRRCRLIVLMLKRAAKVLGKVCCRYAIRPMYRHLALLPILYLFMNSAQLCSAYFPIFTRLPFKQTSKYILSTPREFRGTAVLSQLSLACKSRLPKPLL